MASHDINKPGYHWYVDSGCTRHMCKNKSEFQTYTAVTDDYIRTASNEKVPILGKGTAVISTIYGKIKLQNCLHVPQLMDSK